ncbi:MAG TPA: hypothetical protein VGL81_07285 [Polyangiaceae bacterium]|jgi:hypothetical protein
MKGKPIWPRNKPLPAFSSYEEEVAFLNSYDFTSALEDSDWEGGPLPRVTSAATAPAAPAKTAPQRRRQASVRRG